ncbi:hypothetical protein QZH41_004627 [Actinostola sp. cb2023]|nr:hypothetical protein QZH41_004627 [Actinostola sp. cb2023]
MEVFTNQSTAFVSDWLCQSGLEKLVDVFEESIAKQKAISEAIHVKEFSKCSNLHTELRTLFGQRNQVQKKLSDLQKKQAQHLKYVANTNLNLKRSKKREDTEVKEPKLDIRSFLQVKGAATESRQESDPYDENDGNESGDTVILSIDDDERGSASKKRKLEYKDGKDKQAGDKVIGDKQVGDKVIGDKQVCDKVIGDKQVGDKVIGDKQVGDKVIGDKQVGDKVIGDKQVGDKVIGDKQIGDKVIGDKQVGDKVIGDKQVGDKVIGDKQVGNKVIGDKQVSDKVIGDKQVGDKVIGNKQVGDKVIGDKQVGDKVIGDEQVDDKMIGDKQVDDKMIGDKQNKSFSNMAYDSEKAQQRLLRMSLAALTVDGRVYIVEKKDRSGERGIELYNSWDLSNDEGKLLKSYWTGFETTVKPHSNVLMSAWELYNIKQGDLSTEEFISKIRILIKEANYPSDLRERFLRDYFVFGINSSRTRKECLKEGNSLTFKRAKELAKTVKNLLKKADASGQDHYLGMLMYYTTPIDSKLPAPASLLNHRAYRTQIPTSGRLQRTQDQVSYLLSKGVHAAFIGEEQADEQADEQIIQVVEHCDKLFSLVDIYRYVDIWHPSIANDILFVIGNIFNDIGLEDIPEVDLPDDINDWYTDIWDMGVDDTSLLEIPTEYFELLENSDSDED